MKGHTVIAALIGGAAAFPAVLNNMFSEESHQLEKRAAFPEGFPDIDPQFDELTLAKRATPAQDASRARTNCGFLTGPCLTFNAKEQYVSTSGQHAYKSPAADEIRGPCPGLNAAANHAYLPRSGIATLTETIDGLGQNYGMSVDLAGFLGGYAIAFDGDIISMTWSIGGPQPQSSLGAGILGKPQGISFSHNKYEGDTSIARGDAYTHNGDAHSLQVPRFVAAFATGRSNDRYTLDGFAQQFGRNVQESISTNPYYFAPLFSTTLVAPAAYNFVINMMSNHTASTTSGYLNGAIFKQFFGIAGKYPHFRWLRGQERIPENWYRRPMITPYTAHTGVFGDLAANFAAYPQDFRFGGNTHGVNSYTGINIENFTGGVYNAKNLFQGDNLACFFFENQQQAVPDFLKGGVNDVAGATKVIQTALAPLAQLKCKKLSKYDNDVFNKYPGRSYSPTGPATNY